MAFEDFTLNVHFTVSAWIRPDSVATNRTVFSKTDSSYNLAFKAYVDTNSQLAAEVATADLTSSEAKTTTISALNTNWTFVVYAMSLQSNATTCEVNFKVNEDTADDVVSFSTGYRYIDSSTPHKAHVGATQTGSSSFSDPYAGFIYSLYIDNTYLSGFQPRLGDAYRWLIALMTVLESSILMNTQVVHRVMLHVPSVVRVAVEPAYVIPATVHPTATYALIESVKIALITPMDHAQAPCVPQVDLPRRPAARALAESVPYVLIQTSHVRDVIQIALRAT